MIQNSPIQAASWSARDLPNVPEFLRALIEKARMMLDLERVVVFGSRARGDHTARSDYDLCFFLKTQRNWSEFVIDIQEHAATLCALDLVNFDLIDSQLAEEVTHNGVSLYEREKSSDRSQQP